MYGYIYLTTNLINDKKYVGQHKSSKFDKRYKGSGKLIKKAFKKYGIENFKCEVLEECNSLDELNNKERYWIKKLDAANSSNFYNLSNGGAGFGGLSGDKNPSKRIDVRRKMSKNHADFRGRNNPNFGGLTEANKRHLSESRIRSGVAKGKNNPMYGKRGKDSPNYNRIHIHKDNQSKTIPKDELETYIKNGWIKGKKPSVEIKNAAQDRIWVTNGHICKHPKVFELYDYIGWYFGKLHKKSIVSSSTIESVLDKRNRGVNE